VFPWTFLLVAIVSTAFTAYFLTNYFGTYRTASRAAWSAGVRESAERDLRAGKWRSFAAASKELPELSLRYFLIEYGGESCLSSKEAVQRLRPGAAALELLKNGGFETRNGKNLLGWRAYGKPTVVSSSSRAHSGKQAVQVSPQDGYVQPVPVTAGQRYRLTHFSRSDSPTSNARLQVNWLDTRGKILDVSMAVMPTTPDWKEYDLSATAPDGVATAVVYANSQDGPVWIDDVFFGREEK
jgi:hypothetical protein